MHSTSPTGGIVLLKPLQLSTMTDADFRDALRLLDSALELLCQPRPRHECSDERRRRIGALALEFDLLRLRLGKPQGVAGRN
jgi:hypothetical protein